MASCLCDLHGDRFPLLLDGLQLLDERLLLLPELLQLLQQRVLVFLLELREQLQTLPVNQTRLSINPLTVISTNYSSSRSFSCSGDNSSRHFLNQTRLSIKHACQVNIHQRGSINCNKYSFVFVNETKPSNSPGNQNLKLGSVSIKYIYQICVIYNFLLTQCRICHQHTVACISIPPLNLSTFRSSL